VGYKNQRPRTYSQSQQRQRYQAVHITVLPSFRRANDQYITQQWQIRNTIDPPSSQDIPEVISVVNELGIDIGGFVEALLRCTKQRDL
jgi:hypothetical protein